MRLPSSPLMVMLAFPSCQAPEQKQSDAAELLSRVGHRGVIPLDDKNYKVSREPREATG